MKNTLINWSLVLLLSSYFPVIIGSVLVIIACLSAGPRVWSRRLCVTGLWVTGLFLLFAAVSLANFLHNAGAKWGGMAAMPVLACIPVVLEFAGLLAVARWRCGASRSLDAPGYESRASST